MNCAALQPLPHDVLTLVAEATSDRTLGFIGEDRVNVVELNIAVDGLR